MAKQWLRKASLVVADGASGLDISALRFKFQIKAADKETPQAAFIRVYNLSDDTAQRIQKEFSRVILQCGYEEGGFGIIFDGTIKQVRNGRESSIDSFLDILGADGDFSNFAVLSATLAAGSTPQARIGAAVKGMGTTTGYMPDDIQGPTLPRGKVLYGMARDELHVQAASAGLTYSIQKGKIVFLPLNGYRPNEAVVVNAQTGMVGWPEQTEAGIKVRMLLNPQLDVGCKLKIDNKSILLAQAPASGTSAQVQFENLNANVPVNADGLYRIHVIEHVGDTRGNDWYSDVICLSIDQTTSQGLTSRGQL